MIEKPEPSFDVASKDIAYGLGIMLWWASGNGDDKHRFDEGVTILAIGIRRALEEATR